MSITSAVFGNADNTAVRVTFSNGQAGPMAANDPRLAGVSIAPYAVPAAVPSSITPLQARRALRGAGLLGAVNAYIAQQPDEVQETWEYAVTVLRDDPLICAAAEALGLTEAQLDELFVAAAAL